MIRPSDWTPLAESDPIPGDPDAVAALAHRYARMAEAIRDQARQLRTMCTDDAWDSDSGRKFTDAAQKTAGKLDQAFERYAATAKALSGYHPELRQAQVESLAARALAIELRAQREAADRQSALQNAADCRPLGQTPAVPVMRAGDDLYEARRKLSEAIERRDRAARTAAAQIKSISDHDGLKDSHWEKVKAWVHDQDWIKKISSIASTIASVAALMALVAAVIPGLQPLAVILEAVALVATAVALVTHLVLALTGEGSWLDLAVDVVSIATFGLGRAAGTGVRVAAAGVRGGARLNRARQLMAVTGEVRGGGIAARAGRRSAAKAWRTVVRELGPGSQAQARAAVSAIPKHLFPTPSQFARALNPRTIARETKTALKELSSPSTVVTNVRQTWERAHHLPSDIAAEVRGLNSIPEILFDPGAVKSLHTQVRAYWGWTGGGIGLDAANNSGLMDTPKKWLVAAP